jgi:hypothetical protein
LPGNEVAYAQVSNVKSPLPITKSCESTVFRKLPEPRIMLPDVPDGTADAVVGFNKDSEIKSVNAKNPIPNLRNKKVCVLALIMGKS